MPSAHGNASHRVPSIPLAWSSPERRTKAWKQTLAALNTQERNDLSLLLGKPLTGATVTVRLDVLDSRLCASAIGLGLRDTLEELGPPQPRATPPGRRHSGAGDR
ncbi:TIGR02679 domain-containing protein [Streptomyces sp. MK37H]|uniref:TIGR02679 domain-containing protein n=1 Tax=Streptomyces sp. MK37H TaxID=2699117 RepID=UPI001B37A73F|nr:TIGR02679 domain-containing protein [Streptomyces sp. MK37H]MBP8532120.1 hypothetical protein [Streptomyces sp. MK37H]